MMILVNLCQPINVVIVIVIANGLRFVFEFLSGDRSAQSNCPVFPLEGFV